MSIAARVLVAVILIGTIAGATTVAMATAAIYRTGTIAVNVHQDHGSGIDVAVPAGLADLALSVLPDRAIKIVLDEASGELEDLEVWLPVAGAAWREFARAPDFVLVEVESDREHVRVEKKNRLLIVTVSGPGERVRVEVPLRTINRLVSKLAS